MVQRPPTLRPRGSRSAPLTHVLHTLGASLSGGHGGRTQSHWGCGGPGRGLGRTEALLRGRGAGVPSKWSCGFWSAGTRDCEALLWDTHACVQAHTLCPHTHTHTHTHMHTRAGAAGAQWLLLLPSATLGWPTQPPAMLCKGSRGWVEDTGPKGLRARGSSRS